MQQEFNSPEKQALAANNRRVGLILFSIALIFFIGIMVKRSMLG